RTSAPGNCFTIGLGEASEENVRRRAREARLSGATVVKVKVGEENDVARLHGLNQCWRGAMPLRLDANGMLSPDGARALLGECAALPIQSLEQPYAAGDSELTAKLRDLYAQTGVPLVADESVCRLDEARRWATSGGYQAFNVRVGKCGGLLASSRIMNVARTSGIPLLRTGEKCMTMQERIFQYIWSNLNPQLTFDPTQNLMGDGVLDSLAMINLIVWLEETFKITVETEELVPENFATLDAMANYIAKACPVG